MQTIYLDNSATTPILPAAKQAMTDAMECFGNPSSLHPVGQESFRLLGECRSAIAATLGVRGTLTAGQLIFTASGSEADNLALIGTAYAKPRRRGGRIITTDSEHAAIENTMQALEREGFEVIRISTKGGVLDMEQYQAALNSKTFLVSMMAVNNETGAKYDLARAFALAKANNPDTVTHTDAVQGYLKYRMTPAALSADMMTLSAHKIGGPKGVGALYVSPAALKRRDLVSHIYGGGQESGFRSGTENLVGIAGFAAAAKVGYATLSEVTARLAELHAYAIERLSTLPVQLNLPAGESAPHILNLTLPDIKSETMLHALSAHGICVSHGSACSSRAQKGSRALLSFGLSPDAAASSIRISFGVQNTRSDVDLLAATLEDEVERLVKIHR